MVARKHSRLSKMEPQVTDPVSWMKPPHSRSVALPGASFITSGPLPPSQELHEQTWSQARHPQGTVSAKVDHEPRLPRCSSTPSCPAVWLTQMGSSSVFFTRTVTGVA